MIKKIEELREKEETKKTTEVVDKKIVADTELKADLLQKINDANTNSDEKNTTTKDFLSCMGLVLIILSMY